MTQVLFWTVVALALASMILAVLVLRLRAEVRRLSAASSFEGSGWRGTESAVEGSGWRGTESAVEDSGWRGTRNAVEGSGWRGTRRAVKERSDRPESPRQQRPDPRPDRRSDPKAADAGGNQIAVITELAEPPADVPNLTTARIASVTLGRPLIKVAALAYGVRAALDSEHRLRMTLAFRSELRRQRKLRRRARQAAPAPSTGGGT